MPEAKFLDCILYSREQLVKEYQAMPEKGNPEDLPQVLSPPYCNHRPPNLPLSILFCCYIVSLCVLQAPWGIISIKAQDEDFETPMQPITIMRNSLVTS